MHETEFATCVARAQRATSIAALHALAAATEAAHPGDPDAGRFADVCRLYAVELLARLRSPAGLRRPRRPLPRDYSETAYR